jgi:hypothetical protein
MRLRAFVVRGLVSSVSSVSSVSRLSSLVGFVSGFFFLIKYKKKNSRHL